VALLSKGFSRVVIDLAALRYVDSTGLGVLIAFERRLPEDGVIALAQAPSSVSTLLEITGLDATFNVFATVDQALAHVQNAGDAPRVELAPSPDAAIVIGLAATALPFAESAGDELRRWVRILSLQGEAGRALQRVGVTDVDVELATDAQSNAAGPEAHAEAVTRVTQAAAAIAGDREAASVSTVDLLLAVMMVYGDAFDRELTEHGTSSTDLIECLATGGNPAGVS
jgi:hypothetical protein